MYAQLVILIIVTSLSSNGDEDFKFRIGLPEYICDKNGGIRDVSKDMTTIRLLGKDAQSASYKFDVNFHTIGSKCRNNQRCTLIVWRGVRELDNYLKNYPTEQMQTGLIEINNTMFMPGVKYLLKVTVINDGTVIDEKQLSLDYVDEAIKKSVKKPMASLLLLGPDSSYAYATYIINAEPTICSDITSYQFNWELADKNGNLTVLLYKGTELKIPPYTFQGLQTYTIKCDLINAADGASIADTQQSVNILSKGLLLRFPIKSLTTRTNQPVTIKAFVKDLDNMDGDMRILWSCIDTITNEECHIQSDTNELEIDPGFTKPGKYNISLEISKSEFTETDWCTVEAMEDVPIVEMDEIEVPVNPSSGIEIHATVYEIKTFCTLQWTSPNEDGYEFLDLTTVPGNVGESINVTSKEDFFLHELEEFSNGTVNRKHDLIIPPPSGTWGGLKGDTKYLFRLIIKCPSIIPENYDELNETELILEETITLTSDIVIETNDPPKMQSLEVKPIEGEAFLTLFSFKTQKAEDKDTDGPILYKFGYILENRDIILWNLGEITNCEATLPYSSEKIQTFLESCDNFNSCGRVFGPLVTTHVPEQIGSNYTRSILQPFVEQMNSEDYFRAFTEASSVLHSMGETRDFISQRIGEEFDNFFNSEHHSGNHWQSSANNLIRNINNFNPQLQLPETILNKLIELRNKLSEETEKYTQRKLLAYRRLKRDMTLQDVKNYIEVSELIITTSNDPAKVNLEKDNLRKQLHNYMEKLCVSLKQTEVGLELKTLILSVEKLTKNSLNSFISVPFERNSWQTYARIKLVNMKESRQKCIGKALFRDYLGKTGMIYFAEILNGDEINESNEIVVFLPKNKSLDGNPNCIVYRDGWHSDCKIMQIIANYVKCSCKYLGYYYLEYNQVTVLPSTATTVSITEKIVDEASTKTYEEKPSTANNFETVSYIVIVASIIGIIILIVILRKIFHEDDDNDDSETFEFPKYAQLHNDELLNDAHI